MIKIRLWTGDWVVQYEGDGTSCTGWGGLGTLETGKLDIWSSYSWQSLRIKLNCDNKLTMLIAKWMLQIASAKLHAWKSLKINKPARWRDRFNGYVRYLNWRYLPYIKGLRGIRPKVPYPSSRTPRNSHINDTTVMQLTATHQRLPLRAQADTAILTWWKAWTSKSWHVNAWFKVQVFPWTVSPIAHSKPPLPSWFGKSCNPTLGNNGFNLIIFIAVQHIELVV